MRPKAVAGMTVNPGRKTREDKGQFRHRFQQRGGWSPLDEKHMGFARSGGRDGMHAAGKDNFGAEPTD